MGEVGKPIQGDRIRQVLSSHTEKGKKRWVFSERWGDDDLNPIQTHVGSNRFIHRIESGPGYMNFNPPMPMDWMNLKPGEEKTVHPVGFNKDNSFPCQMRAKRMGNETITVPAGEFKHCRKVRIELIPQDPNEGEQPPPFTFIAWYHPKANGLVKESFQYTSPDSKEPPVTGTSLLKSYTKPNHISENKTMESLSARTLNGITWYVDSKAKERGEPGISHSYMGSLATAVNYIDGDLDPAWMMGTSGFAFRIFVCSDFCPSAMSQFQFSKILPESVAQAGYQPIYVERMWEEKGKEKERQDRAHSEIIEAIERGVPAITWDAANVEWGLIIGYDNEKKSYLIFTNEGKRSSLPFAKLGRNGIDILSVTIPGEPNQRSREEIIVNSLQAAVAHSEQKEWLDRPDTQDGLPAFDTWATSFENWAMLLRAGKGRRISPEIPKFAAYYTGNWYSARCYARDYLKAIANEDPSLLKAADAYAQVASHLKPIWDSLSNQELLDSELLESFAQHLRNAKAAEMVGIESIKECLTRAEFTLFAREALN